ncbi:MAG: MBL fold metallo-hydrolase [Pseudomonadota bacterium]
MPHLIHLFSRRRFLTTSGAAALAVTAGCSGASEQSAASSAGNTVEAAANPAVRYEFIRNATARLHYAGKRLLLDPMLSAKGALPSFADIAPNPTVELPVPAAGIVRDIDAVIVSHMHSDHFDDAAADLLPKSIPMVTCANSYSPDFAKPDDRVSFQAALQDKGFTDVTAISTDEAAPTTLDGITIRQVWGLHGRGEVGQLLGNVNGIVLQAEGHPTIYWAGDTILDDAEMTAILTRFRPDIVIAHTGGPVIEAISPELLLMDAAQGMRLFQMAEQANANVRMIAVHMGALDHCFSTRDQLRTAMADLDPGRTARIAIPADGETLDFA